MERCERSSLATLFGRRTGLCVAAVKRGLGEGGRLRGVTVGVSYRLRAKVGDGPVSLQTFTKTPDKFFEPTHASSLLSSQLGTIRGGVSCGPRLSAFGHSRQGRMRGPERQPRPGGHSG